jgi:hypothetical protein
MFERRRLVAAISLAVVVVVAAACVGESTPSPLATARHTARAAAASPTVRPSHSAVASPAAQPTSTPASSATGVAVGLGGNLCLLLAPGDFAAAGVTGAGAPTISTDENGGHYCVYSGKSGATGGIEFDAFTGDPVGTYQTIVGEIGAVTELSAADLPGADQAGVSLNSPAGMAAIVVRSGQLIFDISLPASGSARTQLIALAALVIRRGSALT